MQSTQRTPVNATRPECCTGRKVTETHQALLWHVRNDDPTCPSRLVLHAIRETPEQIVVTLRHINRLRKAWGLNRGKGRPRQVDSQKKRWAAKGRSSVSLLLCRSLVSMYSQRGGNNTGV